MTQTDFYRIISWILSWSFHFLIKASICDNFYKKNFRSYKCLEITNNNQHSCMFTAKIIKNPSIIQNKQEVLWLHDLYLIFQWDFGPLSESKVLVHYIKLPLITTKPAQASVHLPVDIVHLTGMVRVELKRLRAVRVHVHLTVGHVGHWLRESRKLKKSHDTRKSK